MASQAEAEAYSSSSTPLNPPNTGAAMDKLRAFGSQVSSSVSPFAARGQQWFKEQTGNAGEKTELPHDYVELETRIEALKITHQKLLAATSQYANEAYDYPPNIRESFQDMGKSISEKVCPHLYSPQPRDILTPDLCTGRSTLEGRQRSRGPGSPDCPADREAAAQDLQPRHRPRLPRRLPDTGHGDPAGQHRARPALPRPREVCHRAREGRRGQAGTG